MGRPPAREAAAAALLQCAATRWPSEVLGSRVTLANRPAKRVARAGANVWSGFSQHRGRAFKERDLRRHGPAL
eukprot:8770167-Lingulodinium_polyedra.AAC.1